MNRSHNPRRGQAAVEFLITYGWAILAVLVVLGGLAYFTGFYARMLPNSCAIEAPFSCVEHKVTTDGTVKLMIHNGAGVDLDNVYIELWCNQKDAQKVSALFPLVRDQQRINGSAILLACPLEGKAFRAKFAVTFAESGDATNHTVNGDMRTVVESS